jgi:hypothetical protein
MLQPAIVSTALISCLACTTHLLAAEPVALDRFEKLHKLIKPQTDERNWEQLPWMVDFWEARREAAKLGKPIVLWERDGHPLGCV